MKNLLAILIVALSSYSFASSEISLEVKTSSSTSKEQTQSLNVKVDEAKVFTIENNAKLELIASLFEEDKVMLMGKIYQFDGKEYVLAGEPKLVTAFGVPATIEFGDETKEIYTFVITPVR